MSKVISVDEDHGTLDPERICKYCGRKGTILCDGGFETCIHNDCISHDQEPKATSRVEELEYALEIYGQHKEWCHWLHFTTEDCNCGLHAVQNNNEGRE